MRKPVIGQQPTTRPDKSRLRGPIRSDSRQAADTTQMHVLLGNTRGTLLRRYPFAASPYVKDQSVLKAVASELANKASVKKPNKCRNRTGSCSINELVSANQHRLVKVVHALINECS